MPQNNARRRIEAKQIYGVRMASPKEHPYDHYSYDTFQAVPGQHDHSRLCSQHPQGVGGAGIAAPVLPDVNSMGLAIEISGLKQTEHMPYQ